MPQVVDPSLVTLINARAYSALQVFRRNLGNTAYEWGTGVWTDQSYADPAWLTSLNYTKVVGLGTLATQNGTFSGTSSGFNSGDQSSVTGTAGNLSGTPTLPNGTAAATQAASDNSTKLATTAYADAAVATAVTGTLKFKGATDCSANPNYPAALKGDVYVVSVAGKIGGASGAAVDIGDQFLAIADNAGGTQASVGASWTILEHNLQGALLSANNLSDVASVSSSRTNLGGTTIGQSVFTLTNPSAITFPRFNADNSVTALSASSFLSAIGGGTGNGTVTAIGVSTANGVSGSSSGGTTPNLTVTLGAITPSSVNGNTITTGTGTLTLSTFTLTVSATSSISGNNTGDQSSVSGNAGTATALQNSRTINGVSFDGTGNIVTGMGLTPTAVKTTNYNAAVFDLVPCNPSGGNFTVTLPTAPVDKTWIAVKIVVAPAGNTVSVNCGGSDVYNVAGGSTSATLSILSQSLVLEYQSSTAIWFVVANDMGLTQLDARYARNPPRTASTTSSTTPTPNADTTDEYILTALAANATFGAPTGTPSQGQKLLIRIKSDATPRTLAFNAIYRAGTIALPTTTIASKTMYLGFVFDTEDTKWDFVAYVDNL